MNLFRTDQKIRFTYDDEEINYLYMNGVIDREIAGDDRYIKFSSPFVQKRLFGYFSRALFAETGKLYDPFEDLESIANDDGINIKNLMARYERYLRENRHWLLKEAPRGSDLKIYEAVFHFNLYTYIYRFLEDMGEARVWPEFPTGNGKIDIIINYNGKVYGLELKSYKTRPLYKKALIGAGAYGKELGLKEIWLIFFVETIDDRNRELLEKDYEDIETGVVVKPVFVQIGGSDEG